MEACLHGRVALIGLASTVFTADQMAKHGMTGGERLAIVVADRDDPGTMPWSVVFENVRITIAKE